jgi:hypothetical protein
MNLRDLTRKVVNDYRMPHADRYELFLREFDNKVEVVGWMQDPTIDDRVFENREMLIPKRWVTIGVIDAEERIRV